MKFVQGNLLKATEHSIAHGCNCSGGFGSGVAGAFAATYPEVKDAYHMFINGNGVGAHNLGKVSAVETEDEKYTVYNCFTQVSFGSDGAKYADYRAVINALEIVIDDIIADNKERVLAIPEIGCGLGGLQWSILEPILREIETAYDFEFTVYRL